MVSIRIFLLTGLILATSILATCSADSQCPESAPCCSQYGYCGSSSLHCLSGCDPLGSFKHGSCAPMPRCRDQHISFINHQTHHVDAAQFKGDPKTALMTLEGGAVRPAKTGLRLAVAQASGSGGGTSLSSTRYLYYGRVTSRVRHENHQGIVAAFITLSPTRDEIDWEMTTNNPQNAQTNYYYHWTTVPRYDNGKNAKVPSNFTTSDYHDYSINWTPTRIDFEIDGQLIRTVERSSTLGLDGAYQFPSTPARIQLSVWSSDGMEAGTQAWTGGKPDWTKADSKKTFTAQVRSLDIKCADPLTLGSDYTAYAFSAHMDPTTGQPKILGTKKSTIVR